MAETLIGIELDGSRVTVVETVGEMAVSVRTISIEDSAEAVELALAGIKVKRGDPAIRVALGSSSMVARKLDITAQMLDRKNFEEACYKAMPLDRASTSTAGLFFEKEELKAGIDKLTSGFAAISPQSEIQAAYGAMGARRSEVVPLPFIFEGQDGLWLGTRYAVSDLTLVVSGHVVAYRQLRAGGLGSIASILADPDFPTSGLDRLEIFLNNTGASDPIVESEVARWVRSLALEVRQTVDFWTRSGETVPNEITILGPGAEVRGVAQSLEEVELKSVFPEELSRAMAYLPPADRPLAAVAYFSSLSSGLGSPQSVFINSSAEGKNRFNLLKNKKILSYISAVTLLVAFTALVGVPTTSAWLAKRSSEKDLKRYQALYAPYKDTYDKISSLSVKKSIARKSLLGEIDYSTVLRVVSSTTPSGYTIIQLTASKNENNEVVATLTSSKSNGNYADLVNWLKALRARPEVYQAWSSSFTSRDGVTSFQISITFRDSELLVKGREIKRSLNE